MLAVQLEGFDDIDHSKESSFFVSYILLRLPFVFLFPSQFTLVKRNISYDTFCTVSYKQLSR